MTVKRALLIVTAVSLTACSSVEERDAHMKRQVEIVQVQKNAQASVAAAEANAKAKLYEALAAVAMANPEQASAVTVALAVQGVGKESETDDSRIVPLQPMVNEGLEFAKVFAAPLANVTTAVATAYINADVAKTQSDNAAAVQINDALQDSRIVEAVASVGKAAAETSGLFVSGDNYTLSDSASISQDTLSTVETTTTTTTTTTETNTSSELTDSYNATTTNTDSLNDQSDNTDNSYVTYGDQQMTLQDLISFLTASGEPYSFTVGEETYTDTTDEEEEQGLTCVPTFEGYVCTGG